MEHFDISGHVSSIEKLIATVERVTSTQIVTIDSEYPVVELDQVASNSQKAQQILKWQAQRSIQQMIEDEWRFYQNTLNHR